MSRNATLRGARATLEQLMNTAASRRQGGPPLTDLQHSRRQSITERQETAQKRPARSESFGKRRYHRAADALPAVNRDQLGWIFSTAPRVGNGISWFRELASSIKSRISGAPHSQQGGLMQPVMLPMTELRPVEPRTTLALALLLCIDKGEVNTEFHQISLRGVVDDCGLFREIRREYYKRRKLVSRITLRSVKAVSLARVRPLPIPRQL